MRTILLSLLALTASACHRDPAPAASPVQEPGPSGAPSASPVGLPPAGGDLNAAVRTVRLYYERIGAKDYPGAWRLWWNGGAASGKSEAAFARGFAGTTRTSVTITGPGQAEGAAGSIYATIPVRVDALLASGAEQHFAGNYVVRRVNDVPGSSAEERRWHIYSATLKAADMEKGRS